MKLFIIVALCIVSALALPAFDETKQVANDESPLTIVELEPQDIEASDEELARVKRHGYGGM